MNRKQQRETRTAIVDAARKQVGYHSQPQKTNGFSPRGYNNRDWNGSYIDRVLTDAFGTEPEVSFLSTVTALGYYAVRNGLYRKPRVGDIVFYNFATDPAEWDHQPHVGVVTELRPNGGFRAIEAQTFTGRPQGTQLADGIHERERYATDLLAVVRPTARKTVAPVTGRPAVRMSFFGSNPKTAARATETVQLALNRMRPDFIFNRGRRDGAFKSAFGLYGRETGTAKARGDLDPSVLRRLADETGIVIE